MLHNQVAPLAAIVRPQRSLLRRIRTTRELSAPFSFGRTRHSVLQAYACILEKRGRQGDGLGREDSTSTASILALAVC